MSLPYIQQNPETSPVDFDGFLAEMQEAGVEKEFVGALMDTYRNETRRRIVALNDAVAAREPSRIADSAYTMLSAAVTIRAVTFAELLRQMERAGTRGDIRCAVALIKRVRRECDALLTFLGGAIESGK